jgi:hypothetical protein
MARLEPVRFTTPGARRLVSEPRLYGAHHVLISYKRTLSYTAFCASSRLVEGDA